MAPSGTTRSRIRGKIPRKQIRRRPVHTASAESCPTDLDGRERILTVAIRSFAELGYEGTTTAQVARAAGVTQPLVHHHFGSKEGLWRAAMERLFSGIDQIVPSPGEGSTRGGLVAITQRYMDFLAAHPGLTKVVAREGSVSSPRLTYLIEHFLREPYQRVLEAVRAAQKAELIAPEIRPELLLFLVSGAWSQLFDVHAFAYETLGVDAYEEQTRHDFLLMIGALLEKGLIRSRPAGQDP